MLALGSEPPQASNRSVSALCRGLLAVLRAGRRATTRWWAAGPRPWCATYAARNLGRRASAYTRRSVPTSLRPSSSCCPRECPVSRHAHVCIVNGDSYGKRERGREGARECSSAVWHGEYVSSCLHHEYARCLRTCVNVCVCVCARARVYICVRAYQIFVGSAAASAAAACASTGKARFRVHTASSGELPV